MAVVARLEAILHANTAQFERSMDKAEGRMHTAGKMAGRAGLAIAGGLAFGLEKSVHAAIDAQASQARLAQAFATAHLSAGKLEPQVKKLEASSRKLGFTEHEVHDSLGSLIVATHSMSKASRDLSVAQDIARFKHVDLTAATKMLSMAMAGSQRATKQLGLTVQAETKFADAAKEAYKKQKDALDAQFPSMSKMTAAQKAQFYAQRDALDQQYAAAKASAVLEDKSITSAKVIDLVSQKLHGQADAYSKTAAGSMEQFKAQLNFLEISMGTGLLPILTKVATAVANASAYFAKHHEQTKLLTIALGVLAGALLAARAAQLLMNLAVLANPYVAAIAAVVAAGIAIYVFRDKLKNVYEWVKAHWVLMTTIIAGPIGLAVAEVIKHRDAIANAFTSLPGMVGDAIGGAMHFLKKKLGQIFDWHRIVGWIKDALGFGSPSPYFMAIGTDMVTSMAKGVGDAAGVLKDAVFHLASKYVPSFGLGGASLPPGQHARVGPGGPSGPSGGLVPQVREALGFAQAHGWRGSVTSGFRSYAQQKYLWDHAEQLGLIRGVTVARPGTSSHESGQAVDVTDYGTFGRIMRMAPAFERLYNRLPKDPVHYSVSGYDKGGWLPTGLSLALNNTGRPERVIPGGSGGDTVIVQVGDKEIARVIFDQVRGKARVFTGRNGRPAFEGG